MRSENTFKKYVFLTKTITKAKRVKYMVDVSVHSATTTSKVEYIHCSITLITSELSLNVLAFNSSGCFVARGLFVLKEKVMVLQGRIHGGSIGAIAPPPKTYESNLIHHNFVQFGKQLLWYRVISSSIALSQQFCKAYFIFLTVAKLLWDLTTKYYWNRPP